MRRCTDVVVADPEAEGFSFCKAQLDAWRRVQSSSVQAQASPILSRSCACTTSSATADVLMTWMSYRTEKQSSTRYSELSSSSLVMSG